jgi:hypothetical protein
MPRLSSCLALVVLFAWARPARATPAELELARSLDRAGYEQAALATIGAVLDRPSDLTRANALAFLGAKAATTPAAAHLEARLARVSPAEIERARTGTDRASASGLAYLAGKAAYAAGRDEDAVRAFEKVDRASPLVPRAEILAGAAHVRLRRSVPAMASFQRAIRDADAAPDPGYVRDLTNLSIARTFGAAAVRRDESDTPVADAIKLSAAVKFYLLVDPSSDLWPDAAYELAWTYFLAGDYLEAEGYARALASPAFADAHAIDGLILRAVMEFSTCRYDLASATAVRARDEATRISLALAPLVAATAPNGFVALLDAVRAGRTNAGAARPSIERALGDRGIVQRMGYLARLGREEALAARAPADVAERERRAIAEERARVVQDTSRALKEMYEAEVARLNRASADATKVLIDVTAAQRNQLDASIVAGLVTAQEGLRNRLERIPPVLWPFEARLPGDRRRLESGYFYSPSDSRCGR